MKLSLYRTKSGQAAVEYILLLVIVVSLALGAKKAFSSLNDFMTSYIGDYVSCLMEYGELPSMGIPEADLKKHTQDGKKCDTDFVAFTFENGRPPNSSSSGSASSSGSGKGSGSGEKGKSGAGSSGSGNRNSDSGGGIDGRRKKSALSSAGLSSGKNYGSTDGAGGKSKTFVIEDEDDEESRRRAERLNRRRSTSYSGSSEKYKVVTGKLEEEINKLSPPKSKGPTTRIVATNEDGGRFKPYKKVFVPPEPKKEAEIKNDGEGFSFGYLFKWLLIAGMVIAIVILMGSQIMNYNNSGE